MRFTKMNGLGNDYIYLDATKEEIILSKAQIVNICDRHFGVGSDGIILITPSKIADYGMRVFNADGSQAEMCGNALRCVARYVFDKKHAPVNVLIETLAGVKRAIVNKDGTVTANMGKPLSDFVPQKLYFDTVIIGYYVNVGNPHFVVFVDDVDLMFTKYARMISTYTKKFPQQTNVEFVKLNATANSLSARVYERGSAETMACGTGAAAIFEIASKFGYCGTNAVVKLKGGDIICRHNEVGEVLIRGEVRYVFEGEIKL